MVTVAIIAVVFALFGWIVSGAIADEIGRERGRRIEASLLSLFFGPLGLVIVCVLPPRN